MNNPRASLTNNYSDMGQRQEATELSEKVLDGRAKDTGQWTPRHLRSDDTRRMKARSENWYEINSSFLDLPPAFPSNPSFEPLLHLPCPVSGPRCAECGLFSSRRMS